MSVKKVLQDQIRELNFEKFEDVASLVENPVYPEDFMSMNIEDLRAGLAYWINLANHRGNVILGMLPADKKVKTQEAYVDCVAQDAICVDED